MTYLGMQIMVEGLALAAFGFMHDLTEEPLLKKMLRYIMSDEARHVAFGVLSLQEVYQDMTLAEIQHRQEFASRPPCACVTASCSRKSGSTWGSTAESCASDSSTHRRRPRSSSGCCSPRLSRTVASSVCSTPARAGCAESSRRSA